MTVRRHWPALLAVGLLTACGGGEPAQEAAPEDSPDRSDSRVRMGLTLVQEGLVDAAMEQFHRLAESPDHQLRPGNEPEWASQLLRQLVRRRRLDLADSLLSESGPFESRSPELRYVSANVASLRGEPDEALRLYRQIDGDPELMLRVDHEMATLHLLEGRPPAAIEAARRGLALAPQQHTLRILIAEAQRREGRVDEAMQTLAEVPAGSDRWVAEGEILLNELDRPDSALVVLEKAFQATPGIPNVRYLLGRALLAGGNAERATKAFLPLAERDPPFQDSRKRLAEAYREIGREEAADSLLQIERALETREQWLELRREGLVASQAGELESALDSFERALELAPREADLHNDVGAVLARMERWEQAEAAFREASRLEPEDPTYVQNLARLYQRTGNVDARDEALSRWRALTLVDSTAAVDKP